MKEHTHKYLIAIILLIAIIFGLFIFKQIQIQEKWQPECVEWNYKTLNCTCHFISNKQDIKITSNQNITGEICGTDTSLSCSFGGSYYNYSVIANCTTANITVNWSCEPNKYCIKEILVRDLRGD